MNHDPALATPHRPLARTALHGWHAARGARFTENDGWQIPVASLSAEQQAAVVRAGIGLADLSALAKLTLSGRGVATVTHAWLGESAAARAGDVAVWEADGPILACRLTNDSLLLLAPGPSSSGIASRLAGLRGADAVIDHDVTSFYACFCLAGPRTDELLRRVTSYDMSRAATGSGWCAQVALAGVHAILIRVAGLSPPETRICVAWDVAEYVWEELLRAGGELGLTALGIDDLRRVFGQGK
jgi:glycine cleavage system aminomethyltransferase T